MAFALYVALARVFGTEFVRVFSYSMACVSFIICSLLLALYLIEDGFILGFILGFVRVFGTHNKIPLLLLISLLFCFCFLYRHFP